ncbi:phosphatidic acid phosphatase type 2/haloperoxidase [Kockovaella imperatae]|uniref:Phosphatidic acid phosphatase type 2/haloperoxidase n=1 Tax=Kockovaella imperatae TaxID=4999 RepID=A0A1Y1ULP2_9TREE|nr:phosphatidic acid phosphatase type 2/haloperoxidase [Kockovaella imperatae]ORX38970.1 phosphatidic acid phosphatase type 2/haloperoxidase [Kockovaella imperatae]
MKLDKQRTLKLVWSYLPDWVLTIGLWVDGYRRLFSVTDASLAHPYAEHERIPVWLLAVLCGIVPAILIVLMGAGIQRSAWDVHCGILGLILGLGLSQTFTTIIKITAGRPRPDLFSRCQLPEDLTSNPVHGLTSWTVCERTDLLTEGFRSFPSGHASFAWTGMWYLILYAAAKLRLFNRRSHTWKSWILLAPLSCAALVSISRTMDYRHHSTDVIAGGIIGILAGWLSYRQFYPSLGDSASYKPYSPRIPPSDQGIPLHTTRIDRPRSNVENSVRASLIPVPHRTVTSKTENTSGLESASHIAYSQDPSHRQLASPLNRPDERPSDATLRGSA